jgi:aldose 1-epimerase
LINYGATLVSAAVPDKFNKSENIILSYKDLSDYFSDTSYIGSTVGRVANRITGARFVLNGKTYDLDKNDGENSNHGGFNGFNKKIFDFEVTDNAVVFYTESKDGESSFPGNLRFSVKYSLSDDNELMIEFNGESDRDTIFNPTNHAYFNLSPDSENILDHELKTSAKEYLEMNDQFLPTGKILPVAETGFDFRNFRKISDMIPLKKEILKGYNAYFIAEKQSPGEFVLSASLRDRNSGRYLNVYSDMPGVQFYTGDYLSGKHQPFAGLCLEAQFYPDAPNHSNFSSILLKAGEPVSHRIMYKFGVLTDFTD